MCLLHLTIFQDKSLFKLGRRTIIYYCSFHCLLTTLILFEKYLFYYIYKDQIKLMAIIKESENAARQKFFVEILLSRKLLCCKMICLIYILIYTSLDKLYIYLWGKNWFIYIDIPTSLWEMHKLENVGLKMCLIKFVLLRKRL